MRRCLTLMTSCFLLVVIVDANAQSLITKLPADDTWATYEVSGSSAGTESIPITIKPHPQTGDGSGKASMFIGQLLDAVVGQAVNMTIPNITIGGERFRLGFATKAAEHGSDGMPSKVVSEDEKKLYLTPGGIYTKADIEANGNLIASQTFKGFQAAHDLNPNTGDKICPVTLTKANPKRSWIVGDKKYEFCCPPALTSF